MASWNFGLLILTLFCGFASAERCVYHHVIGNDTFVYCSEGCCYTYIYPCCEELYYETTVFKFAVACVSISLIITVILILLRYRTIRGRQQTIVRTNPAVAPPSMISGPGYGAFPNQTPGMANPNFGVAPSQYAVAPPAYSSVSAPPPAYKEREELNNFANTK